MVFFLLYRRPKYVPPSPASARSSESNSQSDQPKYYNESMKSGTSGFSNGIPPALSFDRIIEGGTCPPCTIRDFLDYLLRVEHAAENLQFYMWIRGYTERFNKLDQSQSSLCPIWTIEQLEAETNAAQSKATNAVKNVPGVTEVFEGTLFVPGAKVLPNEGFGDPFSTPPRSSAGDSRLNLGMSNNSSLGWEKSLSEKETYTKSAAVAFEGADTKWQPFTIQPYREEIARILATYIVDGGPRELNLSDRDKKAVIHALTHTTHPSAFQNVRATVEWSLRYQAHPNFIRWSICNGNPARNKFAYWLGGVLVGLAIVAQALLTLSKLSRGWRVLPGPFMFIGTGTLYAASQGMCVVLHGFHHRHLRPWELFVNENERDSIDLAKESFESTSSSTSYEDEPWIAKYEERSLFRKIFDREIWIQEPALRMIQDKIFYTAIVVGFVCTALVTAVFLPFKKGHLL